MIDQMIRIDVTADDIRRGRRCDTERCPVALAVGRALGPDWKVSVCRVGIAVRLDRPGRVGMWRKVGNLPQVASFVRDVDMSRDAGIVPFSFRLPNPVYDHRWRGGKW